MTYSGVSVILHSPAEYRNSPYLRLKGQYVIGMIVFWHRIHVNVQIIILILIILHSWQQTLPLSGDFGNSTQEFNCAPVLKSPLYKPSSFKKIIIHVVLSYSRNQWYIQKRNNNLPFGNLCWKIMTYSGDFGNSTIARRVPKFPIFTP